MAYRTLEERFKRLSDIGGALAMLEWDQQAMMPRGGNEARAEQVATLRQMAHELLTDPRTGGLLDEAEAEAGAAGYMAAGQSARDAAAPTHGRSRSSRRWSRRWRAPPRVPR